MSGDLLLIYREVKIDYARVSTADQQASLRTQTGALYEIGCERVYTDIASGTKAQQPGLKQALIALRPDDVLIVPRLDRLGRTTLDTLKTVQRLDEAGVRYRCGHGVSAEQELQWEGCLGCKSFTARKQVLLRCWVLRVRR